MGVMILILLLTLIHTGQDLKPIEEILVGNKVLSLNERTGETSYQPVLELMQHEGTYQLVKVTLENGEQLEATAGHPFYIQGKGWNVAANLKVGDALQLHNGTTLVVKTVDTSTRFAKVYNFSVAQNANYFVGKDGVAVHNSWNCDAIHVTKDGVALPPGKKYKIPEHYVPNPHGRNGSYGEYVNGKFQERLRIDPPTTPGNKGPNYSHYHRNNKGTHYSPKSGDPDRGFSP